MRFFKKKLANLINSLVHYAKGTLKLKPLQLHIALNFRFFQTFLSTFHLSLTILLYYKVLDLLVLRKIPQSSIIAVIL